MGQTVERIDRHPAAKTRKKMHFIPISIFSSVGDIGWKAMDIEYISVFTRFPNNECGQVWINTNRRLMPSDEKSSVSLKKVEYLSDLFSGVNYM